MTDTATVIVDDEIAPEPDAETPQVETLADDDVADDADAEQEDGDGEDGEAELEIEIDLGGTKRKLRADATVGEAAGELQEFAKSLQGDYTRKTQEVAEQKRSVEDARKALDQLGHLNEEVINSYAVGKQLQAELQRLAQIDLNPMWQSQDPKVRDQARQISDRMQRVQQQFQMAVADVAAKEQRLTAGQQTERSRRAAEGEREVARLVPGWSETKASEVVKYATERGIPKDDAEQWRLNPTLTAIVHDAMLYRQAQAKAQQRSGKPRVPQQPIEPMKPATKGRGRGTQDPDRMSTDQWMRYRQKQLQSS